MGGRPTRVTIVRAVCFGKKNLLRPKKGGNIRRRGGDLGEENTFSQGENAVVHGGCPTKGKFSVPPRSEERWGAVGIELKDIESLTYHNSKNIGKRRPKGNRYKGRKRRRSLGSSRGDERITEED